MPVAERTVPPIAAIKGFDGVQLDIDGYLRDAFDDVERAAQELPAVMEWVNELRQGCCEERDLAEADLKVAEAKAYFELKAEGVYQANYGCKPTEDGIKMAVALDPTVRSLKETVARYTALHGRLAGTIVALQTKVELLRSTEATRRKTFDDTTPSRR